MKKPSVLKAITMIPFLIAGSMAIMIVSYILIPMCVVIFVFIVAKAIVDIQEESSS